MASWRTANINGDTDEWQVTTIGAKLNIDKGSAQPEDVLMTPPFDLKAGYYKVTLRIGLPIKNYPFKVGVVKADDTASRTYRHRDSAPQRIQLLFRL